jgi:hypothetical protein
MTPEQHSRLLDMLAEARRQYPWTTELSRRTHDTAPDLGAVFTAENLETFADEEEQFDTQFLMQARELLSAEQLAAFARAQQRRREGQVAQLKIAARMFGSADK